jgi:predicted MFS family arabinose efflux permease
MPHVVSRNLRVPEILILSIGTFTLSVDRYLLTGLMPQVSSNLHVSASAIGQLATLFGLVFAVASPVVAALTEAWERRVLLATGMAIFLAGILLQATATGFPIVAAGSVLAGLGTAAYMPTAYSSAGLLSDHANRARSLAMVVNGATVALVVGVPLAIRVGQLWGWRPSLWILATLAIAAIIPLRALPPITAPPAPQGRWKILADPRVLSLIGVTAVVMAPEFLAVTYLPTILHASGALVPMALLAFGGGGFVGTTLVPLLVNWRGARFALLVGACGVSAFTALLAVTSATRIGAVATMFAIGVSGALTVVPQHHRLLALVPPAAAPVAIGLNGSALYVGVQWGQPLGAPSLPHSVQAACFPPQWASACYRSCSAQSFALKRARLPPRMPTGTCRRSHDGTCLGCLQIPARLQLSGLGGRRVPLQYRHLGAADRPRLAGVHPTHPS